MNEGSVPCISNAVDMLRETECQQALDASIIIFDNCMVENLKGKMPVESDVIEGIQKMAHDAAVKHYHSAALFDEKGTFLEKLSVSYTLFSA